jgi:glutamine amidotransferase PdxT
MLRHSKKLPPCAFTHKVTKEPLEKFTCFDLERNAFGRQDQNFNIEVSIAVDEQHFEQ